MKILVSIIGLVLAANVATADIPDWYKRDITRILGKAKAVVLYRVEAITLVSSDHHHFLYRFDTTTIEVLKGMAPSGNCYWGQSESALDTSEGIGESRLVILARQFDSECGRIEPMYSAPATEEYLELFRGALNETQ